VLELVSWLLLLVLHRTLPLLVVGVLEEFEVAEVETVEEEGRQVVLEGFEEEIVLLSVAEVSSAAVMELLSREE